MTEQQEPYTVTDTAGEVREQRPITIDTSGAKPKPKRRRGRPPKSKMLRVYNKINAKLFLHDGRSLGPMKEGEISEADYAIQSIKDRVVVMR